MMSETLWLLASNALEAGTTLTLDPKDVLETIVEFNAEIAELWSQIDGLHEEATRLSFIFSDMEGELEDAEVANHRLMAQISDVEDQVNDLEGQLRDSEEERARLDGELEDAWAKLEEFENNG